MSLAYRSALDLADGIRRREFSSVEVLEALLARIAERDGHLGLVVTLAEERARAEARAADEAVARGDDLPRFHGVPMTIKDSFSTAGVRTTSGAPELADYVPETDAVPVARLRAAGAVVFGKTNLPIYAGDVQSYNEVFGTSRNPWDRDRAVGGSSGGSAAALAAGFTPLELGSDIGGSIRNPSHCCGTLGHKPSYGIVPALGQIPGPPGTLTQADIAVAGPMARTVDDLEAALDVLAGADDWQGVAWSLSLPPARHRDLAGFRIAAWLNDDFCSIGEDVGEVLESAVAALEDAGARIDRAARPDFDLAYASGVFDQLLGAAQCGGFSRAEVEQMAAEVAAGDGRPWKVNATLRHRAWLSANERRLQMRRKWRDFYCRYDAVLLPVSPLPAIPHDHSEPQWDRTIEVDGHERPYADQIVWMGLTGVAYLPATVVPAGFTPAGLPVGLQIAGPYLEDRTTLELARRVCEVTGGFRPPPGF